MSYRIKSLVGPNVEEKVFSYCDLDHVVEFFTECKEFFSLFKNVSVLCIPKSFLPFFQSIPKMRMWAEAIQNDTQCNIMFANQEDISFCSVVGRERAMLFPGNETATISQCNIIGLARKRKIPFILDSSDKDFIKLECPDCTDVCGCGLSLKAGRIASEKDVADKIRATAFRNIPLWHISRQNLCEQDLKQLAFFVGLLNGVESGKLGALSSFGISSSCVDDIQSQLGNDLSSIAFSMFRAVAYPTAQSADRHRLSIDWHQNEPKKIKGFDLYRVDVVDPRRSGVSNSGIERLLLAKKDGRSEFVYYTSSHDFVEDTIKDRLQ